jgi:anti-anti-sigma regulatory factor
MPPSLTIRTDAVQHVVALYVAGPLVAPDDADLVLAACESAPEDCGLVINLSAVTRISALNLAELRNLARRLTAGGRQLAFVCTELMLRAELIVGDLDSIAPVLAADEQAIPLVTAA